MKNVSEVLKGVGLGLVIGSLLFLLFGCTGIRQTLVSEPKSSTAEEMKVRYLKVALLGEEKDPNQEFLNAVVSSLKELRNKVGLDIGAYTYFQVDLDGARTMNQLHHRLKEWHAPMEPATFDIGLLYTHKFLAEDVAGIALGVLVGMPVFVLSTADVSSCRFAVIRNLGTVEHEIAHLFCAMDGWDNDANRAEVVKNKWRKYDSRGFGVCKNYEEAYPDTRDPRAVWGDKYPEVVERAKARAASFGKKEGTKNNLKRSYPDRLTSL